MIALIVKLTVQDGKGAELEQVFKDLSEKVLANEAGCKLYQLVKSRTEPNVYKVLELYADQEALAAHGATDYFKAASPKMGACLAGRPDMEMLDAV